MMCFSLYAWHEPLLRHVFQGDIAPLDTLASTLPVYLTLLAGSARLSYRFIEFGRAADWRGLFLLSNDGVSRPQAKPVTTTVPPAG
ncbi:MAG: hypothetical protein WDN69_15840 [Aliidongia sp.]